MNTDQPNNVCRLIRSIPYFAELDEIGFRLFESNTKLKIYHPGQVVFLEGEQSLGLYLIEVGWLKASKIGLDGREQVLQTLGPGSVFNSIAVFTNTPNPATITALEASKVWLIMRDPLKQVIINKPELAFQVIEDLSGRILHLVDLVENLSLRTVEARFAHLLLDQAEELAIHRPQWATQTELASQLGTVPDVLNRVMRKLADNGIIHFNRKKIKILNQNQLEAIAKIE